MTEIEKKLVNARAELQATKKRHFNLAALTVMVMMVLVFILGSLFIYWLYQPVQVLSFKQYPIPIRTIRANPGEGGVVILRADYCKNINTTGAIRTSFISLTREYFLPMSQDKQPPGCVNTELPILIPSDLPPDTYHIHFRVDYQVNPITHSIEQYDTKQFKVE